MYAQEGSKPKCSKRHSRCHLSHTRCCYRNVIYQQSAALRNKMLLAGSTRLGSQLQNRAVAIGCQVRLTAPLQCGRPLLSLSRSLMLLRLMLRRMSHSCCPTTLTGEVTMTVQHFLGQARAHLLNVGIVRPREEVTAIDINAFLSRPEGAPPSVGKVADPDKIDVARFLNRLLGLAPEAQGQIFDLYQAVLEASIQRARKEGKYDEGIVDVKGTAITLAQPPQVIRRDGSTGAPTLLFRVHVDRGISWDLAQTLLTGALAPPASVQASALATPHEAAEAGPPLPGHAPISPSPSPGDLTKPKQKLRIRFGGELVSAEDGRRPGKVSTNPKPTPFPLSSSPVDTGLPASSSPSAMTDASLPASSAASPWRDACLSASSPHPLETHVSSVEELLELQEMETQSRHDSLDAAAAPTHKHETWGSSTQSRQSTPPPSQRQPTNNLPHSNLATDPTAVVTATDSKQDPAFGSYQQSAHVRLPAASDLHGSLGTGTALGAALGAPLRADPAPAPSVSGYYRPGRGAVRGLLLALEAQGKGQVTVYRPATGLAARPMRTHELAEKYQRVEPSEAEAQWQHQYSVSGDKPERGVSARGSWRVRELVLIGGLVLPIWGMVERALVKQHRPADRRMHVLRLQTTGENAKRLVGMLLPKGAVEDLLEELRSQQLAAAQTQQAQHAQQAHQPHLNFQNGLHPQASQMTSSELASHIMSGADHIQQLAHVQARLQNGYGGAAGLQPRPAGDGRQAYG